MTLLEASVNAHTVYADENHIEVEPFYTVPEVANLLKISRSILFEEMAQGRLKYLKRGRSRRIPAEWLREYRDLLIAEGQGVAA
jgi:excisionase family DNA binding protein